MIIQGSDIFFKKSMFFPIKRTNNFHHRICLYELDLNLIGRLTNWLQLTTIILILITWLDIVRSRPNYKTIHRIDRDTNTDDKTQTNWKTIPDIEPWEPLRKPQTEHKNEWNLQAAYFYNQLRYAHLNHNLYLLNNSGAKCNDGSPAGYYYRSAKHKAVNSWIIFLEGGWYCFDQETCFLRESNAFSLFSSKLWPKTRTIGGILSADPNANPLYHEYHSVFIPYCSSDLWTGKMYNRTGDFYFHGSRIIRAVIDALPWRSVPKTERVIFAGSSAGGIGVLMNVDRLGRKLFDRIGYPVLVSGIIDSAWFIHIPAFQESPCRNAFECPPEEGINRGMKFWNARIPKECRKAHINGQKWKCYLAPYMYQYLKTPVFIVQSLFDEAQMQMSKVPLLSGGTYAKWAYIQNLGKEVAKSLRIAKGVFAPSCLDHEILTKNNWVHKMIGSIGLVNTIKVWDEQLIRHWIRQKILWWSIHYPHVLLRPQQPQEQQSQPQHAHLNHNPSQTDNSKNDFENSSNSTLIFLSRLVNLLNQQSRHKRDLISEANKLDNFRSYSHKPVSNLNRFIMTKSFLTDGSIINSLTMRKPLSGTKYNQTKRGFTYKSSSSLSLPQSNQYFSSSSSSTSFIRSVYHVIDSCGLFSVDGLSGSYLCPTYINSNNNRTVNSISVGNSNLNYSPAIDYLIPQCNPTCGFISNPQRMKLIDVLALYEVNTDLIASLLGLTITELRNMDSEQQMRALFCGKDRIKREISQFILPKLIT